MIGTGIVLYERRFMRYDQIPVREERWKRGRVRRVFRVVHATLTYVDASVRITCGNFPGGPSLRQRRRGRERQKVTGIGVGASAH
jgi:hypothetical protein